MTFKQERLIKTFNSYHELSTSLIYCMVNYCTLTGENMLGDNFFPHQLLGNWHNFIQLSSGTGAADPKFWFVVSPPGGCHFSAVCIPPVTSTG